MEDTLADAKAELLGDTSRSVQTDTLVNKRDDNLTEELVQTFGDRITDVEVETLGNTLRSR